MPTYRWHRVPLRALSAGALLAVGCGDSVAPPTGGPALSHGGVHGGLTITTATTGEGIPPGYTLSFSGPTGSGTVAFGANQTQTFTTIAAGDYTLELIDVPVNCAVSGGNRRTVSVPDGASASTRFDVSCTAGSGTVSRVTGLGFIGSSVAAPGMERLEFDFEATGAPSGRVVVIDYSVVRDDGTPGRIIVDPATDPATGVRSFIQTSARCVRFGGVGRLNDNNQLFDFVIDACDNASPGAGADSFAVELPARPYVNGGRLTGGDIALSGTEPSPSTGDLTIATATTGEGAPAGYTFTASGPGGSASGTIGATATRTFAGVAAGDYTVTLGTVPDNCTVSGSNLRSVNVPGGGTGSTTFSVTCATTPPPPGNLKVTTSTSGSSLDPDGYRVSVDGVDRGAIGINSSVTITGVAAGSHTVVLSGVAGNCTVSGGTARTVTVTSGATATVGYSVSCTSTNQPPTVNAGPDETALVGLLYSLRLSFSDPNHNGPWSYTIEWGDGSKTTGSTSSEGTITKGHTYFTVLPRSFTVRVTVVDAAGAAGSDTKVVTVLLL